MSIGRQLGLLPALLCLVIVTSSSNSVAATHRQNRATTPRRKNHRHDHWHIRQQQQHSTLMDKQVETLAAFVARIQRGGSSGNDPYYGDYGRRRKAPPGSYYNDRGFDDEDDGNHGDDDTDDGDYYDDYYGGSSSRKQQPSSRSRTPYNNNYAYDKRGPQSSASASSAAIPENVASMFQSIPNIPHLIKNGDRRVGAALLLSGLVVTMLGVSLFFNKTLMRLGNLLFIGGVPMMIGPSRTIAYFVKPEKFRATACLCVGIFLVLVGSPVFGIALEIFGLLNLFGNMFPLILAMAKQLPFIGPILSGGNNKNNNTNNRYNSRRGYDEPGYRADRYNDDRGYDDDYYQDDYYRREEYGRDNPYY